MNKNTKVKFYEILILTALVLVYSWFFYRNFLILPDPGDPLQYIEPSVRKTLIGYFPLIDRLMVADGIRILNLIFPRAEIAGAIYFGLVNFLILFIALIWSYVKKGFWTAFLVGLFLIISYPMLRYANYGYPDATVTLYGLIAFILYHSLKTPKIIFWTGFFTAMAIFSKITGLAIFIYFLIDIILEKRYSDLKIFFAGITSGAIGILLLTGLLFNFSSLGYVFSRISQNITVNTEHRSIARSFVNFLRPEVILPGYLALILFFKLAKDKLNRKIFTFALFFIGFFIALVVLSSHVKVYPHYLYTSSIFATIGLAFYLGSFEDQKNKISQFRYAILSLVLIILGIGLGLKNADYFVLNSFSGLIALPMWLKINYAIFPILVLGLMLGLIKYRSKVWALVFIIIISFISSFFNSASAYSILRKQQNDNNYYYKYAEALSQVSGNYSVYETSQTQGREQNIAVIYFLFYNHDPNLHQLKRQDMTGKIKFLTKEEIPSQKGVIVTEDPLTIRSYFPQARITQKFVWSDGEIDIIKI